MFRTCFLFVYIWPYKPYKQVGPGEHWRSQRGARCPPWLLLEFFSNSRQDSKVVTFWHGGKKKLKKKKTSTWLKVTKPLLLSCPMQLVPISLFFIFYFISLFTPFLLFMILFTAFYSWMMLEILQILLLMSYKLACHQSQK